MIWVRRGVFPRLLIVAFLGSCGHPPVQPPQPILPATGEIPLIVWQVYAFGDIDGHTWNIGSRLSLAEIRDRVHRLQQMAPLLFKANVKLVWSPDDPIPVPDSQLDPDFLRTRDAESWFYDNVVIGQSGNGFWIPGALNLYFVGDVQLPAPDDGALAFTLDPRDFFSFFREYQGAIGFNDCGFDSDFSFDYFPLFPNYQLTPPNVTRLNTAEHELTHYLARFDDTVFNNIHYTITEHTPSMNAWNILREFATPDPFPLFLPGRWNWTTSEQGEIWSRVFAGTWNLP